MSTMFDRRLRRTILMALTTAVGICLGGTAALAQATRPEGALGLYQPTGYPETYGGILYPGAELRALPPARAAAVATQAELRRAEGGLTNTLADLRRLGAHSPELQSALAEEQSAWSDFKAAREHALSDLKNDPTYQATLELRDRLADQIEQARQNPDTRPEQLKAMAEVKLVRATTITAMETSAVGADPQVQLARQRMIAAGNRLSVLRQQLDDAVRANPDVQTARRNVEDARIAAAAAEALFVEARNIAKVAIDYAYDLQYQSRPYSVYQPHYGYGWSDPVVTYPASVGYPIGYPYSWRTTRRSH